MPTTAHIGPPMFRWGVRWHQAVLALQGIRSLKQGLGPTLNCHAALAGTGDAHVAQCAWSPTHVRLAGRVLGGSRASPPSFGEGPAAAARTVICPFSSARSKLSHRVAPAVTERLMASGRHTRT